MAVRAPDVQLRCPGCGRLLGRRADDLVVVKHHGRTIIATDVRLVKCEDCGGVWQPPGSTVELHSPPVEAPRPTR